MRAALPVKRCTTRCTALLLDGFAACSQPEHVFSCFHCAGGYVGYALTTAWNDGQGTAAAAAALTHGDACNGDALQQQEQRIKLQVGASTSALEQVLAAQTGHMDPVTSLAHCMCMMR